jgi:hypothetical protein
MPQLTIDIDDDVQKIISKRAKKNLMTLREQVEDILRKSAVSTKNKAGSSSDKVDDTLVSVFSREKRGNYRRKSK